MKRCIKGIINWYTKWAHQIKTCNLPIWQTSKNCIPKTVRTVCGTPVKTVYGTCHRTVYGTQDKTVFCEPV